MSAALTTIVAVTVGHAATLLAHLQPALAGGGGGGGGAPAAGGGAAPSAPGLGGGSQGGMLQMLFPLAIVGFLYFFMIRPANKQRQEQEKLQKSMQKGDMVVTTSGIIGTVHVLEDRYVVLQLAEKVLVKFERSAITGPWDPNPKVDEKDAKGAAKDLVEKK